MRATVDQQVSITHPGMELQLRSSNLLLEGPHQLGRLFGGDVARGEVPHNLVFHRHQVAANGPVIRPKFDPLCGRLQRRRDR